MSDDYKIEWTSSALREIRKLPENVRRRIGAALHKLCQDESVDTKKLEGDPERWRLRVGDWRVVYAKEHKVFRILSVFNRREGY